MRETERKLVTLSRAQVFSFQCALRKKKGEKGCLCILLCVSSFDFHFSRVEKGEEEISSSVGYREFDIIQAFSSSEDSNI